MLLLFCSVPVVPLLWLLDWLLLIGIIVTVLLFDKSDGNDGDDEDENESCGQQLLSISTEELTAVIIIDRVGATKRSSTVDINVGSN